MAHTEPDDLREVLLTLTPSQFEGFARDLRVLRDRGAESNTQAVLDAVRECAAGDTVSGVSERKAA
jgi:hypothetical protein